MRLIITLFILSSFIFSVHIFLRKMMFSTRDFAFLREAASAANVRYSKSHDVTSGRNAFFANLPVSERSPSSYLTYSNSPSICFLVQAKKKILRFALRLIFYFAKSNKPAVL